MSDYAPTSKVRQYMDGDGLWHWQVLNQRGRVIGHSLDGFKRKVDCTTNMHRVSTALMPPIRWVS